MSRKTRTHTHLHHRLLVMLVLLVVLLQSHFQRVEGVGGGHGHWGH